MSLPPWGRLMGASILCFRFFKKLSVTCLNTQEKMFFCQIGLFGKLVGKSWNLLSSRISENMLLSFKVLEQYKNTYAYFHFAYLIG